MIVHLRKKAAPSKMRKQSFLLAMNIRRHIVLGVDTTRLAWWRNRLLLSKRSNIYNALVLPDDPAFRSFEIRFLLSRFSERIQPRSQILRPPQYIPRASVQEYSSGHKPVFRVVRPL